MPWPQSAALELHLERARDRMGHSRTAWCADYWRGECPVQGWWWRGSQKPNKPSKPPEIDKNSELTDGFAHILAYKSPKTPFFAQKYLTRYTHETFFQEYTNFQAHFLTLVLTALFIYFISLQKVTYCLSFKVICDPLGREKAAQPLRRPIGALLPGKGILCKIRQMDN